MKLLSAALGAALLTTVATACGGSDKPGVASQSVQQTVTSTPTTLPTTTTSSTIAASALNAALLTAADVPGATDTPPSSGDTDLSPCLPGNPLGVKADPAEVKGRGISLKEGNVEISISSSARQGKAEDAAAFVTTLATPTGAACVKSQLEADIASGGTTAKITLTPSALAIADGGALLRLSGTFVDQGKTYVTASDLIVFRKGGIVVFMDSSSLGGPLPATRRGEPLARKIAARLP